MELKDLQYKELEMLKTMLPIFEKYNIRYFLLGGTFLGAVRHNGFIPWDDDIDIGMPRPDYEKFIEIADKELPEYLKVVSFKKDLDYNKYFIKVINKNISFIREDTIEQKETNLWIDIFPLDGLPNNKIIFKVHKLKLMYRRLMLQYSVFKTGVNIKKKRSFIEGWLIKFGYVFTKLVHLNPKKQLLKLEKLMMKYDYVSSKNVINFMGAYKFKEMFPKSYYDNFSMYNFEGIKLPAPTNYDAVLRQMYGDYMKLPPMDQRFSHSIKVQENNDGK